MKKILGLFGISALLYGGYKFISTQVRDVLNWDYKVTGIRVISVSKDKLVLRGYIDFINNSKFPMLVKNFNISVFYKGIELINATETLPIPIEPNSQSTTIIQGETDVKQAESVLLPLAMTLIAKKNVDYQVRGNVLVEALGIDHNIELKEKNITYSNTLLGGLDFNI